MKTIVFDYRTSVSGTWQTTPLTGTALSARVYLMPNAETDNSKIRRAGGKTCENLSPRIMVDIVMSASTFESSNPDVGSSSAGTDAWLYIQRFASAKQRKIVFKPQNSSETVNGLDGYHMFDSAANTYYLNLSDFQVNFENYDQPDRKIRFVVLNMEGQEIYNVT